MDTFFTESYNSYNPDDMGEPTLGFDINRPITHEVYFKVHKSFDTPKLDQICRNFTKQVGYIYGKTTNRQFKYEGVELVSDWPTYSSASISLPSRKFKIFVYIIPKNSLLGGTSLIQGDDIVSIINVYSLEDNYIVNTICHEIAHGFGVAIGEYYSIRLLVDFTGMPPEYKISITNPKDNYWHNPNHIEWLNDPMLVSNPTDPKFCWLSSYIIKSGKFRDGKPPLPDLFNIKLKILVNNQPIDSSNDVIIWRNSKSFYDRIGIYHTDKDGIVKFSWNAGQNNHWTEALSDNFRIIKIFNGTTPILATGLSIWDVEECYIKSNFSSSCNILL